MGRGLHGARRAATPSLDRTAVSLVAAMRSAALGDDSSIRRWREEGGSDRLHGALARRSGLHAHDVEDVVQEAALAAWRAALRGTPLRDDGAWLAGTAAGLCRRARSARGSGTVSLSIDVPDAAPSELERRIRDEDVRRALAGVRAEILRVLPVPHGPAFVAHVLDGRSEREVAAWLHQWGGIGPDRVHGILRDAQAMWRHHLSGGDPLERWPRRYTRRNRRFSTPPPQWPCQ